MTDVYSAPGWRRLVLALGYAALVAAAVWAMAARAGQVVHPPVAVEFAPGSTVSIRAEATFPVARWIVLVDGRAVTGEVAGSSWSAAVSGREVLVQAQRADAADLSAGAIRLHIGSRSSISWGEGTVSVQEALP